MVNIDNEFLINEDYKDKNKKKSAWFEIALSLLSNFN